MKKDNITTETTLRGKKGKYYTCEEFLERETIEFAIKKKKPKYIKKRITA